MQIQQAASIHSSGHAGTGIRVDGFFNTVTINPDVEISTPGKYGVGVLVSNGVGNVIVHRGTVNAGDIDNGFTGTGILFAFGMNTINSIFDLEGNVHRTSATSMLYFSGDEYLRGYLVDRFDLSGTITVENGDALIIGKHAAVREINIMQGAQIEGDIVSNALTSSEFNLERPTINFGNLADSDGVRTSDADLDFHFVFSDDIIGSTPVDANFFGGANDSVGTQLDGTAQFNTVSIFKSGRLTINSSDFTADSGLYNYGFLSIGKNGNLFSQSPFLNLGGGQFTNHGTLSVMGSIENHASLFNDGTVDVIDGDIQLAQGSTFHNEGGTVRADAGDVNISGELTSRDGLIHAGGEVTVFSGGRLQGTPTIEAQLLSNDAGGVMAPGNSIGTMTIDAHYQNNGDIEFEITSQTLPQDSDLIDVVNNHVVVINNLVTYSNRGTFEFIAEAGNYEIGRRYTILQTDTPGSLVVFHRPKTTDNLFDQRIILRSDVDRSMLYTPDAQTYYAYIGRDVPFAQIGRTRNQQAFGTYLDTFITFDDPSPFGTTLQWFRDTLDLIVDEADVRTAMDHLSGSVYGSVNPMLIQQSYANYSRMAANLRSSSAICSLSSDVDSDGWYGSITGFGTGGRVNHDGNASGYDFSAGGTQVLAGIGKGRAQLGGFYNYTNGLLKGAARSNIEINEFGGFVFLDEGDSFLLFAAGGGYATYGVSRSFSFGNTDIQDPMTVQGGDSMGVGLASLYTEAGHDYVFDRWGIRPFAGLAYNYVQGETFRESGSMLSLVGKIDSLASFRSILGTDLSICLSEENSAVLDLRAMWMHEYLNNQAGTITSGFGNGIGGSFVVQGVCLGRDFAFLGANLSREFWQGHGRIYGGYDLILNDQQALNTGSGGLEFYW